jgi:hypothetical protein
LKSIPPFNSTVRTTSVKAHGLLVVIRVAGAVGAVVAVEALPTVALVGFQPAFGDAKSRLRDDFVQAEGATAEDLEGVAVAGWVSEVLSRGREMYQRT